MSTNIIPERTMTYEQYRELLEELFRQGRTTGENQSEDYLQYAKMNLQRMQRLDKTVVITEETKQALQSVKKDYVWLVITEGWCGDAAQNLPALDKMSRESDRIEMKLILRDENLQIMDRYLTNGSRSIPKLICFEKESMKECFIWGPRPAALQSIVMDLKAKNASLEEKGVVTQNWYNHDKTESLQSEFVNLVRNL